MNANASAGPGSLDSRRPSVGPQRPDRRIAIVIAVEFPEPPSPGQRSALIGLLSASCRPLAPFAPRGDTGISGLLSIGIDPLAVILPSILRPMLPIARWAIVAGEAVLSPARPGEFNGQALWRARALLEEGRAGGRSLAIETGDQMRDARLVVLAPWVGEWLAGLSPARRAVLEMVLLEPRLGPARAAAALVNEPATRISKQAISQFLRHAETRHMRALLEIVRRDATSPRPELLAAA